MCSVLRKSLPVILSAAVFMLWLPSGSAASNAADSTRSSVGASCEASISAVPGILTKTFKKQYTIFFRINRYDIDTAFRDNAATLRRMQKEIDSLLADGTITADSISIESAASPDGRNSFNVWLARKRGLSALSFLEKRHPDIDPAIYYIDPVGEDWDTFRQVVYGDPDIPDRERLIGLMESDLPNDEKERRLRQMNSAFRYILKNHVYLMRASSVTYNVSVPMILIGAVDGPEMPELDIYRGDFKYCRTPGEGPSAKKMILAARTNLLMPALNAGIEVPVKYNWSVGADYYFPWFLARNNKYCVEMLAWFVDGKYWFGRDRREEDKLTGHAVGVYGGFGYYDFQWLESGHQGEFLDVGVDYTYSIPLAKDRLRMEFNIGLGWIYTVARHYTPTDDWSELIKDPGIRHRKYHFFGPTRASVSLVVPIRMNTRYGKGGAE